MEKELSLYVHIPFCKRKCLYCDFLSFNAEKELMTRYFNALEREVFVSSRELCEYKVVSVFFGGGTPSYPDSEYICSILSQIQNNYVVTPDAEISIEVNPASAIMDKLLDYKSRGFNRISIGAQSLSDDELLCLGRLHDSRTFYETYENVRRAGFKNVNIDVMSALPGQSLDSYMDTLKKVAELGPEHISAYSLIVEEGTPFYEMELDLPDEDEDREMYHMTRSFLLSSGYHRYEISNYSKDGNECRHNKVYWQRGNYLGLGLGASSMVDDVRWNNVRDINKYIEIMGYGDRPLRQGQTGSWENYRIKEIFGRLRTDREELTEKSRMEEFMFLGLRLTEGVRVSDFEKEFGKSMEAVYGEVMKKYTELGLLKVDDRCALTDRGLDVSNTVMADFLL